MFLFVLYAVVVWYLAVKFRRRWLGYGAVAAGIAGLVILAYFHLLLNQWTHGRIYVRQLQVLLYPYTVVVGLVGFYIASLPRLRHPWACRACGYDRSGLAANNPVCPECGRVEYPLNGTACAHCGHDLKRHSRRAGDCPKCGVGYRPADEPPRARPDPRRLRSIYPRRIRHAAPHNSARPGIPSTTSQRHRDK